MKMLVIGGSGQVGSAICRLGQSHYEVVSTYQTKKQPDLAYEQRQLDLASGKAGQLIAEVKPDLVFLCASYTNVDGCESDVERSYGANVRGVEDVIGACLENSARLVYYSTDYIFDGIAGPYTEESKPSPVCVYGRHKLLAEEAVRSRLPDSLILRTTVVYGPEPQGKNFVLRLIANLRSGQTVNVPIDQVGNPTYNPSLAQVSLKLLEAAPGIYNTAGVERVSRYDFALETCRVFGLDESLVIPVETAKLNQTAKRPLAGGLLMDKVESLFPGTLIGYREGLRELKKLID